MTRKNHTPQPGPQIHPTDLSLERIVFFSDAVMAIAITLLAIDLRVPEMTMAVAAAELPRQLTELMPRIVSFVISFFVIGVYWSGHHRYFGHIRRYDSRLVVLNMLFLFFIVVMPFVAGLLGHFPLIPLSIAIYSAAVAATGYAIGAVWWYASHKRRLIDPDLDLRYIHYTNLIAVTVPTFFLISIPFAFLSPYAALAIWWIGPLATRLALRVIMNRPKTVKGKKSII